MLIQGLQRLTLLDFPGKIACTVFTGGCNMRCPYCHNGSLALGQGEMNISAEELLAFLGSRVGRLDGVCISGGEPTLHRDLPELIREIKALGFTEYARRFGVEALLDRLEENEKNGIVYHREGIMGDYDEFDNVEDLIRFIDTGKR